MASLTTDVRYVKGIGENRAAALTKLGIQTLGDLLAYYPMRWEDRTRTVPIRDLVPGEYACVRATVAQEPRGGRLPGGRTLVQLRAVDAGGVLDISFFNQEYRKASLRKGETYIFYGKAEVQHQRRTMVNPLVEREGQQLLTGRIMPIYHLTAGLNQSTVAKAVRQGLDECGELPEDVLPDEVRRAHHLCYIGFAYENVHFPASPEDLALARRRLVFEELFLLSCGLSLLRSRRETVPGPACHDVALAAFFAALPFSLTHAQQRALSQCMSDMTSGRPMNRLCQGDVGSGKTMVAAGCAWFAAQNGWQTALMAPTEILARQHYENLSPLLEKLGMTCALLTGSTRAKARRETLSALSEGRIDLCIGTHALLTEDVQYQKLGLVITDEQHRFGVAQRSTLAHKGVSPHLLVLSATPIPRTLALIIYGDLDVSIIDELPPGRQRVDTFAVGEKYRQRLNGFIRKQVEAGHQVFIVCPLVEENGKTPDERKAVTAYAQHLQQQVFPDLRVSVLHGRMKPKEKEKIMTAFAAAESDILVSTTVVEVGVDVPNATLMVVENAERFGLSQLHQLRGRVGRGKAKSWCVLLSDNRNEETKRRLKVMTETNDGFKISEEDLKLRGPGDFFGDRQHGLPTLKTADLSCDMRTLDEAQQAAKALLRADPNLKQPEHAPLRRRVLELLQLRDGTLN